MVSLVLETWPFRGRLVSEVREPFLRSTELRSRLLPYSCCQAFGVLPCVCFGFKQLGGSLVLVLSTTGSGWVVSFFPLSGSGFPPLGFWSEFFTCSADKLPSLFSQF